MKKILLSTTAVTALALAGISGANAADPIKIGIGGFMVQHFGYTNQDSKFEKAMANGNQNTVGGYQNWDQKQHSEFHFTGSTKLDNGLEVSVVVEMESARTDFGIDQSYARVVSPTMGEVYIGRHDGANAMMAHMAPVGGGITLNGGEFNVMGVIVRPGDAFDAVSEEGVAFQTNNKVSYISPTYMGFRAGVDFQPSAVENDRATANDLNTGSRWGAALAFDENVEGIDVGADVGYIQFTDGTSRDSWYGGVNLGYAGFTLGGQYANYQQNIRPSTVAGYGVQASGQGYYWDLGLTYETGPYKIGVAYAYSEAEGFVATDEEANAKRWVIGGTYNLGPGVDLAGDVFWAKYVGEDRNSAANPTNHNKGWGVSTALVLSF